jgi:hypothetical protein
MPKVSKPSRFEGITKKIGGILTIISFLSLVAGVGAYFGNVKEKLNAVNEVKINEIKFQETILSLLENYKKESNKKITETEKSLLEKMSIVMSLQGTNDRLQKQIDAILYMNRTTTYNMTIEDTMQRGSDTIQRMEYKSIKSITNNDSIKPKSNPFKFWLWF